MESLVRTGSMEPSGSVTAEERAMTSPSIPIPQPPPKPVVGNLPDIDSGKGILGIAEVAERYGPIVRIQFFNRSVVAISSQELVNEVCDETRFGKVLGRALSEVRDFIGDGLFTARTEEPNWQKAHRILMPAFGHAPQTAPARGRQRPDVRGGRADDQRPSAKPQSAGQRGHPGHHAQRGRPADG